MKDEIKEMNLSEMLFNRDERLLDYITNLQEENERLKNRVQIGQNAFLSLNNKIDKAIEYIKEDIESIIKDLKRSYDYE